MDLGKAEAVTFLALHCWSQASRFHQRSTSEALCPLPGNPHGVWVRLPAAHTAEG